MRKNYAFRPDVANQLSKLLKVDTLGRSESETEVIERLILEAPVGLPTHQK